MQLDNRTDTWEQDIQEISDQIIAGALDGVDLSDLLDGLCIRLNEIGLPLKRVHLAMETLHPMFQAEAYRWIRGHNREHEDIPHHDQPPEAWRRSPLKVLMDSGDIEMRHRLTDSGNWRDFPYLVELREEGVTDYFAMITGFRPVEPGQELDDGMIMSWAGDHADGFSDAHLLALRRLQSRLGLAAKISKREKMASNILAAYLGGDAAERVLAGQIQLGASDVIPCVILYSDLRHSTDLADSLPGREFLDLLNAYFECTAGVVLDFDGDVLRFIGDAVLAIFPISDDRFTELQACQAAYRAAIETERQLGVLNANRRAAGKPEIGLGLALHIGEVLFGNIGVPERVEFSVIGPAVNEACRLEGLTKELETPIVASAEFARALDVDWRDLGRHQLRGVALARHVFAPPVQPQ